MTTNISLAVKQKATVLSKNPWSHYQLAVFEDVANGRGHTVIKAVAGSGKTTTVVAALAFIVFGLKTLFVAFNKAIAEELRKRAPKEVEVSTLHAYGLRTVSRGLGRLRIDGYRLKNIIRDWAKPVTQGLITSQCKLDSVNVLRALAKMEEPDLKDDEECDGQWELMRDLDKVVSLAKGFLAGEEEQINHIIEDFEIESVLQNDALRAPFINDVLQLLIRCSDVTDGCMDFDDMIWLPIVHNLRQYQFDRVFVDETQDLNPAQIEMVFRSVKPGGRIFAVGDPRQAIYRFRGADSAAMDNIVERLKAKVLPLSVCYRCASSIVQKAKEIVPDIEWAPNAPEGQVLEATIKEMKVQAKAGDFILSRTNAPLISLCMSFLKQGRRANIQGRDIGSSLAAFVRKSGASDIPALRDYVETWRDAECKRLSAKRRDTQSVEDKAECVLALSDGALLVQDVISTIERLFDDKSGEGYITLSSTHKAKGMERDTVWMLTSTYMKKVDEENVNLVYVAYTRAQKKLVLVSGEFKSAR